MKILIIITAFFLSACAPSYSKDWRTEVYGPDPVDLQANAFINMVHFMHQNIRVVTPTQEMTNKLNSYLKDAGLVRRCDDNGCALFYGTKRIRINPQYIEVMTYKTTITVTDPRQAVVYIYND